VIGLDQASAASGDTGTGCDAVDMHGARTALTPCRSRTFVPVMPSMSRKTHSSGASPSTSTPCVVPLTLIVKAYGALSFLLLRATRGVNQTRADSLRSASDDGNLCSILVTRPQ